MKIENKYSQNARITSAKKRSSRRKQHLYEKFLKNSNKQNKFEYKSINTF